MESASLVMASRSHNENLFWALLGGGAANFGVVTEVIYYPLKVDKVILYDLTWKYSQAGYVLDTWQTTAPNRPNEFNEDLAIFTNGDGTLSINLIGVYVIPTNQTIKQAKIIINKELQSLDGYLIMEEANSYKNIYERFVSERVYHSYSIGKTILTDKIVPSEILLDRLESMRYDNGRAYLGLQLMGGKIANRQSNETAFYPRQSKFFVDIFNFWDSAVDQVINMKWNGQTFKQLYVTNGPYVYLGFPIPNLPDHLNAYYGENKHRLLKIKHYIDPFNLLKFPGSL